MRARASALFKQWFCFSSILKTPPTPSSLPSNPKYTFKVPTVGEEFYFAIQRCVLFLLSISCSKILVLYTESQISTQFSIHHLMECVSVDTISGRSGLSFVCIAVQFSDQYIAIGTSLPQGYNIYGLGERKDHLRLTP